MQAKEPCALTGVTMLLVACSARSAGLPDLVVPHGLGTNIHFRGAPERDLDMLKAGGFRFIRMDFTWSAIERKRGVYDFGAYDKLTHGLQERGIRILYILDYSNRLYEEDRSVRTDAGRKAFARFAATAAKHYRGRGILWELWNEPNHSNFWRPKPSVKDYMALAGETLPAIRRADPDALCLAPATSEIPLDFLEGCFRQGLLDLVDAVTVHPYRQSGPESVADDILRLRALIARYRPDRPDLPIVSGEWGYSSVWAEFDDRRQGLYLPRQFLTNMSLGIPVSIWYDWHDDGPDPREPEHHFGTVTLDYRPKPAYLSMQRLVRELGGMRYVKRLESPPSDFLLLFSDGRRRSIAGWTTSGPHDAEVVPGRAVRLTGSPEYFPVPPEAESVIAEGAWTVKVISVGVRAGSGRGEPLSPELVVRVRNGLPRTAGVRIAAAPSEALTGRFVSTRGAEGQAPWKVRPALTGVAAAFSLPPGDERVLRWRGVCRSRGERSELTVVADVGGHVSRQRVSFVVVNPIALRVVPHRGKAMVVLKNPSEDRFEGTLRAEIGAKSCSLRVRLHEDPKLCEARPIGRPGGPVTTIAGRDWFGVRIPLPWPAGGGSVRLSLLEGGELAAESGAVRFVPLGVTAGSARAFNEGDPDVPARFELKQVDYGEEVGRTNAPGPAQVGAGLSVGRTNAPGRTGLGLTYRFGKGWKFVRIAPTAAVPVEGTPHEIGAWVRGDMSGNVLRMRFKDRNDRTFQPELGRLDFSGWRFLTARMDDPRVGHWGGKGDPSRIAYPIRIDTFILVDGHKRPVEGEAHFTGLHLLYRR